MTGGQISPKPQLFLFVGRLQDQVAARHTSSGTRHSFLSASVFFISQVIWTVVSGEVQFSPVSCTQLGQSMSRKALKDKTSTQCFYCRMLFQPPIIATSVFRGRGGSFGFNCPQKTFFQGIYFFPTLTPGFLSDRYSKTNLTAYYQEHRTQWRPWNDFLLAQLSSQLTAASSFQILLFKGKAEKSG